MRWIIFFCSWRGSNRCFTKPFESIECYYLLETINQEREIEVRDLYRVVPNTFGTSIDTYNLGNLLSPIHSLITSLLNTHSSLFLRPDKTQILYIWYRYHMKVLFTVKKIRNCRCTIRKYFWKIPFGTPATDKNHNRSFLLQLAEMNTATKLLVSDCYVLYIQKMLNEQIKQVPTLKTTDLYLPIITY